MHHRKFLPRDHQYRKKKKMFNGEVDDHVARRLLTGYEVHEQVKGVETVFGKTGQVQGVKTDYGKMNQSFGSFHIEEIYKLGIVLKLSI